MNPEKLQKLIEENYKVWLMAGHPDVFATWLNAVNAVRDMLWDIDHSVEVVWHHQFRIAEFKGVLQGNNFSLNIPFPMAS